MIFIDAGSTYAKYYDTQLNKYGVINIKDFKDFTLVKNKTVVATGHSAKLFNPNIVINELVALKESVNTIKLDNFTVLDVGSRDIKLVKYINGKFSTCDWNSVCGAMMGFTVDLLLKYFNIDISELKKSNKRLDITCGLLGITRFFDEIAKEREIKESFSMLINGMAKFAYSFADEPKTLFLSGGMSENIIFKNYLEKIMGKNSSFFALGRFAMIDGMKKYIEQKREKVLN